MRRSCAFAVMASGRRPCSCGECVIPYLLFSFGKRRCGWHEPILWGGVFCLVLAAPYAWGRVSVVDARGQAVRLEAPAARIVSLAPHVTEMLFEIGAGAAVVGVSAFSDHPPEARRLPQVGDAFRVDLERLLILRPQLVVAWRSGFKPADLERLEEAGIAVYVAASDTLARIAAELEDLGRLTGHESRAREAAGRFRTRLRDLTRRYGDKTPVPVFYQLWDRPLMTVNGRHVIGELLRRCGGDNPFSRLEQATPTIDVEVLLRADPWVFITAKPPAGDPFARWRELPHLRAVRLGRLYTVPADWVSRPGPRILQGMSRICEILEEVRQGMRGGSRPADVPSRP